MMLRLKNSMNQGWVSSLWMNMWPILPPCYDMYIYLREDKAKVKRFVNSFPMHMKEQIEFEYPKIMDDVVRGV